MVCDAKQQGAEDDRARTGARLMVRPRGLVWLLAVLLLLAGTVSAQSAGGFARERGEDHDGGAGAQIALLAFVAAGAFVPLNLLRRLWLPRALAASRAGAASLAQAGTWLRRSGVNWHMVLGVVTLVAGTFHGLTARASNWELWAGMGGLLALLVLGAILRWRWLPPLARHRGLLLASKWGVTALSLALLLYGHATLRPEGVRFSLEG